MTLALLIRRGFDSVLANWPLLLIRVAGSVAMTLVLVVAILPIVVVVIYSGTMTDIESIVSSEGMVEWLFANAIMIVALILVLTLIVAAAIAIHAFVSGGVAGVYLDGDRRAPRASWHRSQLGAFSPESWFHHARRTWWPIFVIYNLTWGLFLIIILLPLIAVVPLFFAVGERPELGVIGCFALAVWLLVTIAGSILVHAWTEIAILDSVRRTAGNILAPLKNAVSILSSNLLTVVALILLMVFLTIVLASVSIGGQIALETGLHFGDLAVLFVPFQILFSLMQTIVSVFASAWLMACFASIVNESPLS